MRELLGPEVRKRDTAEAGGEEKLYSIICFTYFVAEEIHLSLGLVCAVKAPCCHEAKNLLERIKRAMLSCNLPSNAAPG